MHESQKATRKEAVIGLDEGHVMTPSDSTMAQRVATTASDFQLQRTGRSPQSVGVALNDNTLVVTLHGALTPAEHALAKSAAGAAQVQDFHRQLFADACQPLCDEIGKITGVEVREATAEVGTRTGSLVHVFTSGTMVQVFLLAHSLPADVWNGNQAARP